MSGSGSISKVILVGRLGKDADRASSLSDQRQQRSSRPNPETNRVASCHSLEQTGRSLRGVSFAREASLWEDKAEVKHTITEIVANEVVMLGSKNGSRRMSQASVIEDELGITDEDLPF
jgi:single-stranded DNA-binding protein